MSASFHRGGWEVRWRDADGRRRARRFASEEAARAFDDALAEVARPARRANTASAGRRNGVYSYKTSGGLRWRFVYRRSDGTQTSKRGFASQRAARDGQRRLVEQVSAARCATQGRRSAITGNAGSSVAVRTSRLAPGPGMRSTVERDWFRHSAAVRSVGYLSMTFAAWSLIWLSRSRPVRWRSSRTQSPAADGAADAGLLDRVPDQRQDACSPS